MTVAASGAPASRQRRHSSQRRSKLACRTRLSVSVDFRVVTSPNVTQMAWGQSGPSGQRAFLSPQRIAGGVEVEHLAVVEPV